MTNQTNFILLRIMVSGHEKPFFVPSILLQFVLGQVPLLILLCMRDIKFVYWLRRESLKVKGEEQRLQVQIPPLIFPTKTNKLTFANKKTNFFSSKY